jgi:dTMP kinase
MRIFVIEGLDGSGKTTQCDMLTKQFRVLKFPRRSEFKAVNKYLSGGYGDKLNPYAVSSLFALDRYLALLEYREHQTIICDRYITSNFIYQTKTPIEWIELFEHGLLGIPRPEEVIFLNMTPKYALQLINKRSKKRDIFETSYKKLEATYKRAMAIAREKKWHIINCVDKGKIKHPKRIHREIVKLLEYLVYRIAF